MARLIAIDYGKKRVGLAVTDPQQIIATRLTSLQPNEVLDYLNKYLETEKVEKFIVGYPKRLNNEPSEAIRFINPFVEKLIKKFPDIPVELVDERFTSKMAFQTMIDAGVKKKDRRNKSLIDEVSAVIILQSYLEMQSNQFNV